MKALLFTQILILLVVAGVILLTALDKPVPPSIGMLIGYLLPNPAQTASALFSALGKEPSSPGT